VDAAKRERGNAQVKRMQWEWREERGKEDGEEEYKPIPWCYPTK
jgi:hypothetical protein